MLSQDVAKYIDVPNAETAKVLQLLVWGGFVSSRRGSKGGFHLAGTAEQITMAEVVDFFLARHPSEPDGDSPVMRILRECLAPCEKAFGKLSLADIVTPRRSKAAGGERVTGSQVGQSAPARRQKNRL